MATVSDPRRMTLAGCATVCDRRCTYCRYLPGEDPSWGVVIERDR